MSVAQQSPQSGPIIDLIHMAWGVLVSIVQWMDLAQINDSLSAVVAILTIVLLLYRIILAHLEAVEDTHEDTEGPP